MKELIIKIDDPGERAWDGSPKTFEIQELIRCKDCKHYDSFSQECRNGIDGIMTPNFYCGNAERKEGR